MTKTKATAATADRVVLTCTKREQRMSWIYYKSDTFWPIFKARNQNNTVIPAAGTEAPTCPRSGSSSSSQWSTMSVGGGFKVTVLCPTGHRVTVKVLLSPSTHFIITLFITYIHSFAPGALWTCRPYDPLPPSALIRGVSEISRICLESKSMTPRRGRYCSL